jgi:hypothetical protein
LLRPIVHFLLIGAVLFGFDSLRVQAAGQGSPLGRVVVEPATLDQLRRDAVAQTGNTPSEAALRARVAQWVDQEILYLEALRLGLDRVDPVVRSRLVRNMRFVGGGEETRDDEELYREALELGMDRSDLVVRRRLVQQMRFLLEAAAERLEPSDDVLRAFVASRPQRYRIPDRVRLSHVYLSRDRRALALEADASKLLAKLQAEAVDPQNAASLGDPFLHPAHFGLQSAAQIARQLGAGFGARVLELEPGGWRGPIESAYGLHLVWVHVREPSREPELETVRRSAESAMQAERNAEAMERGLAELRQRYVVDGAAQDGASS